MHFEKKLILQDFFYDTMNVISNVFMLQLQRKEYIYSFFF